MHEIAAVFFDLDDTLIHHPDGLLGIVREVYALAADGDQSESEFQCFRRAFWDATIGLWAAMHNGRITGDEVRLLRIHRALRAIGTDSEDLARQLLAVWDRLNITATVAAPGLYEVLEAATATCHVGMITDGFRAIQRGKIAHFGLERYFDAVHVSEEVGICKPFAGIFEHALAAAGVSAAAAVMVGDNANADIRGALGVGMRAIHITRGGKLGATPGGAQAATSLIEAGRLLRDWPDRAR